MGLLLATPSCLGCYGDLVKCFQDPEYESILVTAQEGRHTSPLSKRMVVVGASTLGLVVAKTLQDEGRPQSFASELGGKRKRAGLQLTLNGCTLIH